MGINFTERGLGGFGSLVGLLRVVWPSFLKRRVTVIVGRLHRHSRPRPWSCWSLLRQHFDPAVGFSIYCRPLAPVHDPGLVRCFFTITSILPSFSRFMVESSSGYSD